MSRRVDAERLGELGEPGFFAVANVVIREDHERTKAV